MKTKILKILACVVGAVVFAALVFLLFLTIVEYCPKQIEELSFYTDTEPLVREKPYSIITWNIGYAGLGKDEDFFMDGGEKVQPDSKKVVEHYFNGIKNTLNSHPSDIIFVQEIDIKSKRSWNINQFEELQESVKKSGPFAYNFKCFFVPYPLPPIGHVESGIATFSNFRTLSAQRISLPVLFKWPVRIANLKRCMLVSRIKVSDQNSSEQRELVLVNFHLEAFDDGEGKVAQTKALKEFIDSEYAKGNYVIAGGDFNQRFPGSEAFPSVWDDCWLPGKLDEKMLDSGWQFAFDDSKPTCRSNHRKYNDSDAASHKWQYHVIDGFIISPNVEKLSVNVIDEDFQNSDHNPVRMHFSLR